jgi:hypothetical protein
LAFRLRNVACAFKVLSVKLKPYKMRTLFAILITTATLFGCHSGTTHEDTNGAGPDNTGTMPGDQSENTTTDATSTDTMNMTDTMQH